MSPADLGIVSEDPLEALAQGLLALAEGRWTADEFARFAGSPGLAEAATDETVARMVEMLAQVEAHAPPDAAWVWAVALEMHGRACISDEQRSKPGLALQLYQAVRPVMLRQGTPEALAEFHFREAYALRQVRQWAEAEAAYHNAIRLGESLVSSGVEYRADLARALTALGGLLRVLNRNDEAAAAFGRAVQLRESLVEAGQTDLTARVASALRSQGGAFSQASRFAEAQAAFDRALALWQGPAGAAPPDDDATSHVAALLGDKAQACLMERRLPEAVDFSDRSLQAHALVRQTGPDQELGAAVVMITRSAALFGLSRWAEAQAASEHAVAVFDAALRGGRVECAPYLAAALRHRALALHPQGRWAEAEADYDRAIGLLDEGGGLTENGNPDFSLAITLNNLAASLLAQGKLRRAVATCDRAAELLGALLDAGHRDAAEELGTALVNRGAALLGLDRKPEALASSVAAIEVLEPLVRDAGRRDLADRLAVALANRGAILVEQGRLAEALPPCERALALYDALTAAGRADLDGDHARALGNVCSLRDSQGLFEDALEAAERAVLKYEALVGFGRTDLVKDFARTLLVAGSLFARAPRQGEEDPARHFFDHAVRLLESAVAGGRSEWEADLAQALMSSVLLLLDRGRLAEAETACDRALGVLQRCTEAGREELRDLHGMTLLNRSLVLQQQGRLDEALEALQGVSPDNYQPDDRRKYHWALADLLLQHGRPAEAQEQYALARRMLHLSRRTAGIDETTIGFVAQRADLLDNAVRCALSLGLLDDALAAVLDGKATVLSDLRERAVGWHAAEPAEVIDARARLVDWLRQPSPAAHAEQEGVSDAWQAERKARTRAYFTVWNRSVSHNPGPAAPASEPAPPDRAAIQRCLQPGWAVLELWKLDNHSLHAFALTHDELTVHPLAFPAHDLAPKLTAFQQSAADPLGGDGDDRILDDLHRYLFAPLADWLRDRAITGLYLVPCGVLHSLPLHAARGPGGRLCDQYQVAYLPSSALLPHLPPLDLSGPVFSLSNPERGTRHALPSANWEGRVIQRRYQHGRGAVCFNGPDATFARTAEWGGASVLHFSGHGVGDEAFAPLSHLRLADDLLLAHDVAYRCPPLRRGALVALNGCQTSARDLRAANEGMGLMTAFLLRGASAVLATLWSVEDRCAADLMLAFLGRLLDEGKPPTEALRLAQREVRGLSLDDLLHRTEEVRRGLPAGSPDQARALADMARLSSSAGRNDEARHLAEQAAPALRQAGLAADADRVLNQVQRAAGRRKRGADDPFRWAAFQLVGRAV